MGLLEQEKDIGLIQGVMPELLKEGEFVFNRPFDRTADQMVGEDFLPTVARIRSIYIPGGDDTDYPELIRTIDRLKKCPETELSEEMIRISRGNSRTIQWWSEIGHRFRQNQDNEKMIAYNPNSPEGGNEIRLATLRKFDQLRFHPWEGKLFDPNIDSTTRTLWLLGKYFRSGGEFMKEEAVDILTWEMLKAYGVYLARRLV